MSRVGNKPVISNPPGDKTRIVQIWWDQDTGQLVMELEE